MVGYFIFTSNNSDHLVVAKNKRFWALPRFTNDKNSLAGKAAALQQGDLCIFYLSRKHSKGGSEILGDGQFEFLARIASSVNSVSQLDVDEAFGEGSYHLGFKITPVATDCACARTTAMSNLDFPSDWATKLRGIRPRQLCLPLKPDGRVLFQKLWNYMCSHPGDKISDDSRHD